LGALSLFASFGTLVIDPNTQTLYVVALSKNSSSTTFYQQRLHALALRLETRSCQGPPRMSFPDREVLNGLFGLSGHPNPAI
jgi:hypothetical protein